MRLWKVLAVWALVTGAYAWVYVSDLEHDPSGIGYERELRFQLLLFAIARWPFLLMALAVAVAAWWVTRRPKVELLYRVL